MPHLLPTILPRINSTELDITQWQTSPLGYNESEKDPAFLQALLTTISSISQEPDKINTEQLEDLISQRVLARRPWYQKHPLILASITACTSLVVAFLFKRRR